MLSAHVLMLWLAPCLLTAQSWPRVTIIKSGPAAPRNPCKDVLNSTSIPFHKLLIRVSVSPLALCYLSDSTSELFFFFFTFPFLPFSPIFSFPSQAQLIKALSFPCILGCVSPLLSPPALESSRKSQGNFHTCLENQTLLQGLRATCWSSNFLSFPWKTVVGGLQLAYSHAEALGILPYL